MDHYLKLFEVPLAHPYQATELAAQIRGGLYEAELGGFVGRQRLTIAEGIGPSTYFRLEVWKEHDDADWGEVQSVTPGHG